VATVRVRREGPRTLSAAEQRWLLDEVLRRRNSKQDAVHPPETGAAEATMKEASSMIERPMPTATDPNPAARAARRAGATLGASAPMDPTVSPIAPRFSERSAEATAVPERPIESGPEPTAVTEASNATVLVSAGPAGPPATRSPTRSAHRAAPVVEQTKYRAVFACCCDQARGAPTEQASS